MTTSPDTARAAETAAAFHGIAAAAVDAMLRHRPERATSLGDHRYDDLLDDHRPEALDAERRDLAGHLAALGAVDTAVLDVGDRVDAEVLRARLEERSFEIDVLREPEWNPLLANPGTALYLLLARDFAPLGDRLRSLAARLSAVPSSLAAARRTLGRMPRVHVETALGQFTGTLTLLATDVERALDAEPALRREVEPAREVAAAALEDHVGWLREAVDTADADPRLGPERYAARLRHRLDTETPADAMLARAEADLERIEEQIAEAAARIAGRSGAGSPALVRSVLDDLATDAPDNDTIVALCREALAATGAFVRERDLVTTYDDPVEIIVMPEIHRGVSVAYCDPPGPLETAALPTFFAVAPTPEAWSAEREASFFREYNRHMVHNLAVHEAMPGHVLQLQHWARYRGSTPVRRAFWSGPFVEGWAVYAEELMVDVGYPGAGRAPALRMQQLKMQLRMTINAILDARVHAQGMTEEEALRLMTRRGHQEEGEAVGKWRRALLTSAQLPTYYVGYTELRDLLHALRSARPHASTREVHDAVLAHGCPPPRHLRPLLGLGQAGRRDQAARRR